MYAFLIQKFITIKLGSFTMKEYSKEHLLNHQNTAQLSLIAYGLDFLPG